MDWRTQRLDYRWHRFVRQEIFEGKIMWDTAKPNGQPRRKLDTSRAKAFFGFEARTPFEEELRRMIEWHGEIAV